MTPLHVIGEALRELLGSVPLGIVRVFFVAVPLAVLVWVVRLPDTETSDGPVTGWSGNLKVWAAVALIIQILIYATV
jgi:hypothetical protein